MRAISDPLPCGERARLLSVGLKDKLVQSLEYLLDINKSSLSVHFKKARTLLDEIVSAKKLSGFAFAFNTLLLQATLDEALDKVIPYFSLLKGRLAVDKIRQLHYRELAEEAAVNQLFKQYILFDFPPDTPIQEPAEKDAKQCTRLINEALTLIEATDSASYLEMSEFVSEFMIFEAGVIKAGSSFDLFGLISFNSVNAKYSVINAAELLIHETAHLYLYMLGTEDPLVTNDFKEKYYSPLRATERPMLGLYHAVFVLSRVICFLKKLIDKPNLSQPDALEAAALIQKYENIISESLRTITSKARLSDLAKELIAC